MRRAWPAALNVRDTETTPVVYYVRVLIHDTHKAPAVENFAWLPVGLISEKPTCGSVSLI